MTTHTTPTTDTTGTGDLLTWGQVSARAGRNEMPALLVANLHRMPLDEIRHAVDAAWRMAEWPEPHLGREAWIGLFDGCGYMVDGEPHLRSTDLPEYVTLYRGAAPGRRRGMSWTSSLEQAAWFAYRFDVNATARVYTARVHRSQVLARITERAEDEYVVDTTELDDRDITIHPGD